MGGQKQPVCVMGWGVGTSERTWGGVGTQRCALGWDGELQEHPSMGWTPISATWLWVGTSKDTLAWDGHLLGGFGRGWVTPGWGGHPWHWVGTFR